MQWGFCGIKDHSVDKALVKEVVKIFSHFFSLSEEIKKKYYDSSLGGARGYTPYKIETPKDGLSPDMKEFWHVGRDLDLNHPYRQWMPDNYVVEEIPDFKNKTQELYQQFDNLGKTILSAIAVYLNLEDTHFDKVVNNGNSVMRPIHYPAITTTEKGERAGAHEDINLITLLIGGHQSGLELLSKDGGWKKINLDDDVIVCNIGDMLQRLTNNYLESTTHRVTASPDEILTSRYSIPFFLHPNPDWLIETLESFVSEDNPNKYEEGILAEDYLQERLQEIKLI
jgi:isopenicillin N synthase-like dioxygenase